MRCLFPFLRFILFLWSVEAAKHNKKVILGRRTEGISWSAPQLSRTFLLLILSLVFHFSSSQTIKGCEKRVEPTNYKERLCSWKSHQMLIHYVSSAVPNLIFICWWAGPSFSSCSVVVAPNPTCWAEHNIVFRVFLLVVRSVPFFVPLEKKNEKWKMRMKSWSCPLFLFPVPKWMADVWDHEWIRIFSSSSAFPLFSISSHLSFSGFSFISSSSPSSVQNQNNNFYPSSSRLWIRFDYPSFQVSINSSTLWSLFNGFFESRRWLL